MKVKKWLFFLLLTIGTVALAALTGRAVGLYLTKNSPVTPKVKIERENYTVLTSSESLGEFLEKEESKKQLKLTETVTPALRPDSARELSSTPPPKRNFTALTAPSSQKQEPSPPATASAYTLQLGSFQKEENAYNLASELRDLGYAPFVQEAESPQGKMYKVLLGSKLTKDQANSLNEELSVYGYQPILIPQK